MRKLTYLIMLTQLVFINNMIAQNRIANAGCVSKPIIVIGKVCGENSLEAFWTNNCSEEIEIEMLILKSNGSWNRGVDYVAPGKTTSSWICNPHHTNQVKWNVKPRHNNYTKNESLLAKKNTCC